LIDPRLRAAVGLANVGPKAVCRELEDDRATVTAFVRDDLTGQGDRIAIRMLHLVELLDGLGQRVRQRLRVAGVGAVDRHGHDRAGVEINCVLGLVSQMGAAVLHLGDLCVGVRRRSPVLVRALLLPFSIEPRQIGARGSLDA
jgi:hypothetical protein